MRDSSKVEKKEDSGDNFKKIRSIPDGSDIMSDFLDK